MEPVRTRARHLRSGPAGTSRRALRCSFCGRAQILVSCLCVCYRPAPVRGRAIGGQGPGFSLLFLYAGWLHELALCAAVWAGAHDPLVLAARF